MAESVMAKFNELPSFNHEGNIQVVIEASRGMKAKCKFDPKYGIFRYDRALPRGLAYPFDWGFIPSTLGEDGDPLDALVLHDAACPIGCVIACDVVAVLDVEQTENGKNSLKNDRFVLIPARDADAEELLSKRLKKELEQFFAAAVLGTGKTISFRGWHSSKEARRRLIKSAVACNGGDAESARPNGSVRDL